jgi:hypothetical protein
LNLKNHIIVSGRSDHENIIDFVKELLHNTHEKIDFSYILLCFNDYELCKKLNNTGIFIIINIFIYNLK